MEGTVFAVAEICQLFKFVLATDDIARQSIQQRPASRQQFLASQILETLSRKRIRYLPNVTTETV